MIGAPLGHFRPGRLGGVDVLVLHTAEGARTADDLIAYAQTTDRVISFHSTVDDHTRRDLVAFGDTAYAAPGANADGEQLELCGFAAWSRAEWLRHTGMLEQTALWLAERCRVRAIPPVLLSASDLLADRRGITRHSDVSAAFHLSDHTDPGPGLPLDLILARVKSVLTAATTSAPRPTVKPAPPYPGRPLRLGSSGQAVVAWQRQMRQRGWQLAVDGRYGTHSAMTCASFQREKHLRPIDGVVGPVTWRATWLARVT